jgi:hypothetical protein
MELIATDSWRDKGGRSGSIRELSGQLIITQTPENHRQILRLLEQLRETRAIQVTIQARLIEPTERTKAQFAARLRGLGVQFYKDEEFQELLADLQATGARTVAEPSLTLNNGQRASINIVHGDAALTLDVQASASADRKYATLTLEGPDEPRTSTTVSIPDQQWLLVPRPKEAGADKEIWTLIRPTLLTQREVVATPAPKP